MKNLLKLIVLAVMLISYLPGYGQVGTGLENSLGLNVGNLRNGMGVQEYNKSKNNINIKGSSLLFENNYSGRIGLKGSKVSRVVTLNYDLLTGVTIVYAVDENYYIEPQYVDSLFIEDPINNRETKFVKMKNDDKETIMEVLCEGEVILLKEHSAKLLKPNYNKALDTGIKEYRVSKKNAYYAYYDGELKLLPKKSQNIFKKKILPRTFRKNFSLKQYSLKNEEALIKVFTSLNESI